MCGVWCVWSGVLNGVWCAESGVLGVGGLCGSECVLSGFSVYTYIIFSNIIKH